MPGRDEHLLSANRFEAFLGQINTAHPYKEWVVVVWFYVVLHYVDAFLATKGHQQINGHTDRTAKMQLYVETRAISDTFHRLYKESKEARYEGGQYTQGDLNQIQPLYDKVRSKMRETLGL